MQSLRGIVGGRSGVTAMFSRCWSLARGGIQPSVAPAPSVLAPQAPRRTLHVSAVAYAPDQTVAPARTYTQFSIYKGKAAVTFKAIAPTFRPGFSGQYSNYTLEREGALFLEFAPANAQPQGGQVTNRSYDWQSKITFALKPVELAQLTDVDNLPDVSKGIDLYHDPNKGSNDPSAVRTSKRLKLVYNPSGDGYLLTLTHTKEGVPPVNLTVPVSRAEFVVLKHLAGYLIPRMLGFDMLFEGAGAVPTNLANGAAAGGNGY